jgi:ABC-type lipoprotein export system ATPase subunit
MPAAAPLVQAQHLSKNYPMGRSVVKALRDVSFTVPRGSFTVIAGPSGSGKSTLLHLLSCLDKPDSGTLRIAGQEMNALRDSGLRSFARAGWDSFFKPSILSRSSMRLRTSSIRCG